MAARNGTILGAVAVTVPPNRFVVQELIELFQMPVP